MSNTNDSLYPEIDTTNFTTPLSKGDPAWSGKVSLPKNTLSGEKTPLSGVAERESQQERSELLNSGCPIESNASSPSQLLSVGCSDTGQRSNAECGEKKSGMGTDQCTNPSPDTQLSLDERIVNYLSSGGLFNPELMEHEKVRDLIIDCRDEIESLRRQLEEARKK